MLREDFIWGGAVTAHQSEGAYTEGGKSPAVCDLVPKPEVSDFKDGIDSYHRYDEDFALLEDLGMKCFRFSVDWSRVMPDGEHWSEEGLAFYDRFIDSMIAHGLEPMCSLYHFEMPQVLMEKHNGFASREVTEKFVQMAEALIDRWHDKIKYWISFNEQNSIGLEDSHKIMYGAVRPEGVSERKFTAQVVHNTFVAHAKVARKVHSYPDLKMLGMVIYIPLYPATCHPQDQLESREAMAVQDMYLDMFARGAYTSLMWKRWEDADALPEMEEGDLELLKDSVCDWLTFSYYFSSVASRGKKSIDMNGNAEMLKNPYLKASEWGWQIDPDGLQLALLNLEAKYHMPVMIVENGYGTRDEVVDGKIEDDERIAYMADHMEAMKRAVKQGVDLRGYLMWAPIDILSSQGDMDKRYGVVYVNRTNKELKDMKRIPKKSYDWLKSVIACNGETTGA